MQSLLDKLNIATTNPGACTGPNGWISDPVGETLVSFNPATAQPIAAVVQATYQIF